jgi:hypothetical protein
MVRRYPASEELGVAPQNDRQTVHNSGASIISPIEMFL